MLGGWTELEVYELVRQVVSLITDKRQWEASFFYVSGMPGENVFDCELIRFWGAKVKVSVTSC